MSLSASTLLTDLDHIDERLEKLSFMINLAENLAQAVSISGERIELQLSYIVEQLRIGSEATSLLQREIHEMKVEMVSHNAFQEAMVPISPRPERTAFG
jgi:hypothetical protein